ncbi:hypothetical protein A9Q81_27670 [Gammaproteobacteria bacterium 42_54_T18]|nr:hypothetical protein A9Q81_27670 [Gammaproteobacteria bacterium 42_54_T18]
MHLNVADVESWYNERHPDLDIGDPVPTFCFDCFPEIEEGMEVEVRLKLGQYQVDRLDIGIVNKVYKSEAGELYLVRFSKDGNEISELFCRPEIRKVKESFDEKHNKANSVGKK